MAGPGEDDISGPLDPCQEERLQPREGCCLVQGMGHTLRYEGGGEEGERGRERGEMGWRRGEARGKGEMGGGREERDER